GHQRVAPGPAAPPTLSDVSTGGALGPNLAQSVICVALSFEGFLNASVAAGIPTSISRANADGTTDNYGGGSARKSVNATITTANDGNSTHSLRASVAAGHGAGPHARDWGPAGTELPAALTPLT